MKSRVENLIAAITNATAVANSKIDTPDTGTCNLDSVVIELPRWRKEDIDEVIKSTGIRISDKLSGIWSRYRFLSIPTGGQGDRNTVMVEEAVKSLKADGYSAMVYYQID